MTVTSENNIAFLKAVPFFAELKNEDVYQLLQNARVKLSPKGALLYLHGDMADSFYVMLSGWVKLFRQAPDGDESVISALTRGDVFGESALLSEKATYAASCQVVEDATVLVIPGTAMREMVSKNNDVTLAVLASMSSQMNQLNLHIEHLTVMNAAQRVGCFLLRMCADQKYGTVALSFPYDKSLVAARLGMKAETFSRALKQLRNEAGVIVQGTSVVLKDVGTLMGYCCTKCSGIDKECQFSSHKEQQIQVQAAG